MTPCPPWCAEGFHAWEPDGDEYVREHESAELADGVTLYTVDYFRDGCTELQEPVVVVDGATVEVSDLRRVLAHVA